jgi:hypothetical protein
MCHAGEEDTFEWTEEEMEEGPEQLAVLEADTEVDGGPAWTPFFSSSNDQVKNQVRLGSRVMGSCGSTLVVGHADFLLVQRQSHWSC